MSSVPRRLAVPSKSGKVLAVTIGGKLYYGDSNSEEENYWILAPIMNGFNIISSNYKLSIEYDQNRGEELFADVIPRTIWYTTPESEIYTIDSDGERKYMWSVLDGICVTPDEHLSEKWEFLTPKTSSKVGGSNSDEDHDPKEYFMVAIGFTIILVLASIFE